MLIKGGFNCHCSCLQGHRSQGSPEQHSIRSSTQGPDNRMSAGRASFAIFSIVAARTEVSIFFCSSTGTIGEDVVKCKVPFGSDTSSITGVPMSACSCLDVIGMICSRGQAARVEHAYRSVQQRFVIGAEQLFRLGIP